MALDQDGGVWTWGYDYKFEGDEGERSVPTRLVELPSICALGDGETAIDKSGKVWHWNEMLAVQAVPGLTEIVEVIHAENSLAWEGTYHALDARGRVYGWGFNNMGQIGDGTTEDHDRPVLLNGLEQVSSLASTGWTVYALTRAGDVYGWGGYANDRAKNIETLYGPSPSLLRLPHFTEPKMQRWATLSLVSLGSSALRQTHFDLRGGRTPLMQCAAAGFDDEVAVMLTQSGSVDATDADGDTALFYAASRGRAQIVELLLQAGANPNVHRLWGGHSALAQAAAMSLPLSGSRCPPGTTMNDYWEVTLRLLRGGADPSDMYSQNIAAARHTDSGMELIREEHIASYMWLDNLIPVLVMSDSGMGLPHDRWP